MNVPRHYRRFVGGFHGGVRTPFWCWQGEALSRKEVRLPIASRAKVSPLTDDLRSSVPEAEDYELRDLEFSDSTTRVRMWVARGTSSDEALVSMLDTLLRLDAP